MTTVTDYKFTAHIAYREYYQRVQYYVTEVENKSRGYILNLRIAVNNSETAKLQAFNLACRRVVTGRK